jgi:hypothetical protein
MPGEEQLDLDISQDATSMLDTRYYSRSTGYTHTVHPGTQTTAKNCNKDVDNKQYNKDFENISILQVSCDHQLTGNTLFCFHQMHSHQFAVATVQWSGTAHKGW